MCGLYDMHYNCLCTILNYYIFPHDSSPHILPSSSHSVSSFSEPLARHYFMQALLAVVYLHERGVFHRDIKPENCALDGHFNLKLTDFGTNKVRYPLAFTCSSSCQILSLPPSTADSADIGRPWTSFAHCHYRYWHRLVQSTRG